MNGAGALTDICGVILAGGQSLRYSGAGGSPKALAPLLGQPVVLHVAASLALGGVGRIIVLSGENHAALCAGLGLRADPVRALGRLQVDWPNGQSSSLPFEVRFSGASAGTAGRLATLTADEIGPVALLSYTDILSDAALSPMVAACRDGADLAMLAVQPHLPWGVLDIAPDGRITSFAEKPRDTMRWINAGVMALRSGVLAHVHSPGDMLESDVIPRLLARGGLKAQRHGGAWFALDSPKDVLAVNRLAENGPPSWQRWAGLSLRPAETGDVHG